MRDLLEAIATRGVTIVLVKQKRAIALSVVRRLYVMGHGWIVPEGTPSDLAVDAQVRREAREV